MSEIALLSTSEPWERDWSARCHYLIMHCFITLMVVATAFASLAQETKSTASLHWANVSSSYRRFEEIKPKLLNDGDVSIFLSRLWPDESARLEWFNEDAEEWEPGEWESLVAP